VPPLAVRALTALVLLAAFVAAVLLLEPAAFALLVGAILAAAAWEWSRLAGAPAGACAAYAAACVALWYGLAGLAALTDWLLAAALVFWVAVAPAWLARGFLPAARAWRLALGLVVLVPAGAAMLALGRAELLALLGLVWVADVAAYLAGRTLGRRRLAPSISPGKTWEGALGAVFACVIYAMILAMSVPGLRGQVQGAGWFVYLSGAVFLCVSSIVGDLFESAVKRSAGAKDSGALLPGHGGVLDRIDSVTAALPLGALLLRQVGPA
jgi:phosphatidate cytidylyltransferase